jgi:hypothetical protein
MAMDNRIARLAGLGAFGASAGLLALFLLIAFVSRPTVTGGMNAATAAVVWIALGGLFVALIAVHIILGRRLLVLARGWELRHPL